MLAITSSLDIFGSTRMNTATMPTVALQLYLVIICQCCDG